MERQRERIDEALAEFAENTMAHVRQEGELLAGRIDFPGTRTDFRDRHVLIVVRGTTYHKDLRTLRAYIQDVRPMLVGVDGGADAILEAGFAPDVILGDMDSASDRALRMRRRADRARIPRRPRPGPRAPRDSASLRSSSRPPGRARTSRCCSPTRRAPR